MKIKEKSVLINPDNNNSKVSIGKTVEIEDIETKKIKKVKIGSFLTLSNNESNIISYSSPFGELLMNSKINQTKRGKVGSRIKKIKIINIE